MATLLAAVEAITGVACDGYTDAILAGEAAVTVAPVHCVHCDASHAARFLCDPAKAVLDGLAARAAERNITTRDFLDTPIIDNPLGPGFGPDDRLLTQLVVQAAAIPIGDSDVTQPAVVFTGLDHTGAKLPQWLYCGTVTDMERTKKLVADMCDLAIRGTRRSRKTYE